MPGRRGAIRGWALRPVALVLALTCGAVLACALPAAATPVFLTPTEVSDAGQDAFEPQVVVDPSGNEHHIWTRFDGSHTRIQYRLRDQAGTFGPVEDVSAAGQDASQPDIDVDASGNVVAVWTRSDGSNVRVEAAARPANGTFGSVQVVSTAGQNADQPRVSVDDAGKAVAIWIRYDVGASGTGRIQAAVRSPGGSFGGVQTISDQGEVTITPQVESGPAVDANTVAIWARSDGTKLRVQSARRRDVVGFPRPKGASPLRVPLVIAFNACSSPNRTHGPPLASPSCNPPVRSSGPLTVGTPDANTFSAPANSVGFVRYAVLGGDATQPPDEADVAITVSITDVRNSSGGSDYTGRLLVTTPLTITDNDNAAETPEPGTTQEFPFQFPVQCVATGSTSIGGQCDVTTTYDALVPGAVSERQRAVWGLGQVQVKDAGPNGTGYAACPPTCGDGDETVFMRQGIFVP
jgi:hypothetical protein